MDAILLNKIEMNNHIVTYYFSVPNIIAKHINSKYIDKENNCILFVELPEEIDVIEIPEAVLSVAFVGTMIGAAMLYRIPIKVMDIDADYFEAVRKLDVIFKKMYSKGNIQLTLETEKITNCRKKVINLKNSMFFTGGVDATSALVEILDKKPLLLNIVGGDIAIADQKGHDYLEKYFQKLKKEIDGLDYCFVKSNCRELFNEYTFDIVCKKFIDRELWWGYWASIAHIVVMTAVVAPVLYAKNISYHYIGSTHSSESESFDGNNEDIVNAIRYGASKFISVDTKLDRNDKVRKIVDYSSGSQINFELQVCWNKKNGLNCCQCEKCYRTMMNIVAAHGDPNMFGLRYDENKIKVINSFLDTTPIKKDYWKTTQDVLKQEREYWDKTELNWFIDYKFNSPKTYLYKALKLLKGRFCK